MFKRGLSAAAFVCIISISLCGCVTNKDAAVLTADGKDAITVGYAQFCAKYMQSMYDEYYLDYYGTDMWSTDLYGEGSTMEDTVKDEVMDLLKEQYVIREHASELDIALSDDDEKKIKEAAKEFMKDNDDDAIKALGATKEYVIRYLEDTELNDRAIDAIEAQCDVTYTEEDAAQKAFSYVEFSTEPEVDDDGVATEYTKDQLTEIETAAKTVATSADMDATAESLGYTVETATYGSDYAETGDLNEAVYKAVEKLSEGEISDVISVDGTGYYVVRLDSSYDEDATLERLAEMNNEAAEEYYDSTIETWEDDAKLKVIKKVWKQVKFNKLFKTIEEDTEASEE